MILSVVRDLTPGRPVLFVSPRADLDAEAAILGSLTDVFRAGLWPNTTKEEIAAVYARPHALSTIYERRMYWTDPSRFADAEFLFKNPAQKIPGKRFNGATVKDKLQQLKAILKEKSLDTIIINLTSPLAQEFGISIMGALIPKLYPMYLDEHYKYLGIERLYHAPVAMRVLQKPKKEEEMNPIPHPML